MTDVVRRDLRSALLFGLSAIAFAWFGRHLERGSLARMGPGFVPMLLAGGLAVIAAMLGALALARPAPGRDERAFAPALPWGRIALVLGAVVGFGVLLERSGLLAAVTALVFASAAASPWNSWGRAAALAAAVAIVCALVFVFGLGLPLPLV